LKKTPNKFNHKALEEEMNFFEIEVNQQSAGNPINQTDWEYFLQELIQAIYETSQKEAPFHLEYRRIDKDKNVKNFELNLYYAKRQAEGIIVLEKLTQNQLLGHKLMLLFNRFLLESLSLMQL
jgi:hypothetical protein